MESWIFCFNSLSNFIDLFLTSLFYGEYSNMLLWTISLFTTLRQSHYTQHTSSKLRKRFHHVVKQKKASNTSREGCANFLLTVFFWQWHNMMSWTIVYYTSHKFLHICGFSSSFRSVEHLLFSAKIYLFILIKTRVLAVVDNEP